MTEQRLILGCPHCGEQLECPSCDANVLAIAKRAWQPMETAPKLPIDETTNCEPYILLRFGNKGVSVAFWNTDLAEAIDDGEDHAWIEPLTNEPLSNFFSDAPDGWMVLPR